MSKDGVHHHQLTLLERLHKENHGLQHKDLLGLIYKQIQLKSQLRCHRLLLISQEILQYLVMHFTGMQVLDHLQVFLP